MYEYKNVKELLNSKLNDIFSLQTAWNTRESFSLPIKKTLLLMQWTAMRTMFASNALRHIMVERLVVMPRWATNIIHRNWFAAVAVTLHVQRHDNYCTMMFTLNACLLQYIFLFF